MPAHGIINPSYHLDGRVTLVGSNFAANDLSPMLPGPARPGHVCTCAHTNTHTYARACTATTLAGQDELPSFIW